MSKQKLTVLFVNERKGVSQKSGRPYQIFEAQCALEQSREGMSQVLVGVINLSPELAVLGPGEYLAEFALMQGAGADAGKLVARVVSLVPWGVSAQPAARPKADAKQLGTTAAV